MQRISWGIWFWNAVAWQIFNSSEVFFFSFFFLVFVVSHFILFYFILFYLGFLTLITFHYCCYILELWQIHRGLELHQSYCTPNVFSDLSQHSWSVYSGLHACSVLQAQGLSTYRMFPLKSGVHWIWTFGQTCM